MFWKKKSQDNTPVWRSKSGNIECPGKRKCHNCDDTCPVWHNTRGLEKLMVRKYSQAVADFQRAIEIAPDFPDAYNNMGASYGNMNYHQKAYECYKKALNLRTNYPNALIGIIAAEKNLGLCEEALIHCKMLDMIPGKDASELRKQVSDKKLQSIPRGEDNTIYYFNLYANHLLNELKENGTMTFNGDPTITDLTLMANDVCTDIFSESSKSPEALKFNFEARSTINIGLSFLAGAAAVLFWKNNPDEIKQNSLLSVLTKDRGFNLMDEFIIDKLGINYGSEESDRLIQMTGKLAKTSLNEVTSKKGHTLDSYIFCAKSLFMVGVAFQMIRSGMIKGTIDLSQYSPDNQIEEVVGPSSSETPIEPKSSCQSDVIPNNDDPVIPPDKRFKGSTIERDVTQEVALSIYSLKITDEPILKFFYDDKGIPDAIYLSHINDPNLDLILQAEGEDSYLIILSCHALGAGAYITLCQEKYNKPVSEFSEKEHEEIALEIRQTDVYELAIKGLGFSVDGNNKKCLDKIALDGVNAYKQAAGNKTLDKENLRDFMRVMFNAGITIVMRK